MPADAKTVVVVPSVPDKLNVVTRGVTIFGNDLDQPDIKDWDLPGLIYTSTKQALGARYVVSEAVPKDALIDYQSKMTAALDSDDGIANLLASEIKISPAPDLYIVYCVSARSHPYVDALGTPYFMQDIGVSDMRPLLGLPGVPPAVHSFLEVTIIDGRTMKVLADTPLLMPLGKFTEPRPLYGHQYAYPIQELKHFEWHSKWADMPPAEQAKIRSTIEALLQTSVTYTIQKAFVTP